MQNTQQKKYLPTPPTSSNYTFSSDTIQNLLDMCYDFQTEKEKQLYDGLVNCQKALSQRDSTINDLKAIALQWQTKANESKLALKEANKETEERELYLEKHYHAEIQAIKQAQEDQTNEHLDLILYLQKENQQLQNKFGYQQDSILNVTDQQKHLMDSSVHSGTGTLYHSIEAANEIAFSKVVNNRKQSNELIQSIYDTVNAMEESLNDINSNTSSDSEENDRDFCDSPLSTRQLPRPHTPPHLTDMHPHHSTTLASADVCTIHEPTLLEKQNPSSLLSKTQSCKISSAPASYVERKRFSSMIEPSHLSSRKKWVQRKPIRNSIISSY